MNQVYLDTARLLTQAAPLVAQLPGIRWKLANLDRLAKANPKKLNAQERALDRVLGEGGR